jgi:proteic killer suppression protein
LAQRANDRLEILDAASRLEELNLPGYQLHALHTKPVRYSIHINGPWCITFEWYAPRALKVDVEQYH